MDVLTYKYGTLVSKLKEVTLQDEIKRQILDQTHKEVEDYIAQEVAVTGKTPHDNDLKKLFIEIVDQKRKVHQLQE